MRCSESMPLITARYGTSASSALTSSSAHSRSTGIASTARPYRVSRPCSMMPRPSRKVIARRYAIRSSGTGSSRSSAATPRSAHVIATRSESPASWNSGAVGLSDAKSMSRSLRMNTRPPATRPCTRPAIWRISFAPRFSLVSTFLPRSTTDVKRVSSMITVSRPCTLSALCPAAVIARKYGFFSSPSRKGRRMRIGSPPW